MPPQFQDDDIDSFMRKRTATAPKPTPAPKSAPVADDDVDGFMSRRTGSVPTPATKKEQRRQDITNLQDELTATSPQVKPGNTLNVTTGRQYPTPPPKPFQSPIDMRLNAPNEAQKAFDRAAAAVRPAPAQPKPRNAFQTPRPKPMLERVMAQQAIERQEPTTVETDPQRLEQLRQTTARQLAEQRAMRIRQTRQSQSGLDPLGRVVDRALAWYGGAKPDEIAEAMPPINPIENVGAHLTGSIIRGVTGLPEGVLRQVDNYFNREAVQTAELLESFANQEGRSPESREAFRQQAKATLESQSRLGDYLEPLTKVGRSVTGNLLPTNPNVQASYNPLNRGFWEVSLPQAAGSTAPMLAGGAAVKALGLPSAVSRLVALIMSAGMATPEKYHEARDQGATPEQLSRTVDIAALSSVPEMFGARSLRGDIAKRAGQTLPRHIATQTGQESGTEALQSVTSDLGDKYYAKTKPNLTARQMLDNALMGAVPGAFMGFGGGMIATPQVLAERQAAREVLKQQQDTRSAIDQRSAANAAAIASQPATAQPVTEPLTEPLAAQPQPSAPGTAPIQPQSTQPEGLPRLPARELSAQDKFAQVYGAKEPVENRINAMIGKAETLLGSQNENDRKMGERMMNRALTAIRQTEGYLAEAQMPPDAERPFTAVRDAIEARLSNTGRAKNTPSQVTTPQVQAFNDAALGAKVDAEEAAKAGNWEAARDHYKSAMDALTEVQKIARRTKNADLLTNIGSEKSAVNALFQAAKTRANQAARTAQRQANAPTAGLPAQKPARVESAPLFRPEAQVNPEGGNPQMPEPTFTDRLNEAARRDEAARGKAKPAKRLLSRIAELGGISDRYAGELQGVKDARRIGVIRQKAEMSPDVLARQLQSEGYDVDPEDLNTLWEAARRDIAGRDERTSGTAEIERRLAEEEAAYNERQATPSKKGRIVEVGGEQVELSDEQAQRWATEVDEPIRFAKERHASRVAAGVDKQQADSALKGEMMRIAAKKREIAGRLTAKEQEAVAKKEASNYQGKLVSVEVNGKQLNGTVVGMSFGKVRVKLSNGNVISVSPDNVQARRTPAQPFDETVAEADATLPPTERELQAQAEPTNRLREAEYEGGEMQRYSKPLEGQTNALSDAVPKISADLPSDYESRVLGESEAKTEGAKRIWRGSAESWQVTKTEWEDFVRSFNVVHGNRPSAIRHAASGEEILNTPKGETHRLAVIAAKRAGENIPAKVLADYPDLQGTFQPDTADLREVREFMKRKPQTEQFTEEPPTAPLARRREPIRPPTPASPRQVGNRPLSVDVAGTRTPVAMSPEFPRARREMVRQGREVEARLTEGQDKGEFGNVAEAMFKSNTPDVLHGQDSFFHDPDVKGKLGLTRDAEMADVRRELKTQLARSLGLSADEVSLSHIKPEIWRAWAKQKGLGREAVRKLEAGIARAERKNNAIKTNAAIVAEESQRAKSEVREPAAKAGKSIDQQIKDIRDLVGWVIDQKEADRQIAELKARQKPKITEMRPAPPEGAEYRTEEGGTVYPIEEAKPVRYSSKSKFPATKIMPDDASPFAARPQPVGRAAEERPDGWLENLGRETRIKVRRAEAQEANDAQIIPLESGRSVPLPSTAREERIPIRERERGEVVPLEPRRDRIGKQERGAIVPLPASRTGAESGETVSIGWKQREGKTEKATTRDVEPGSMSYRDAVRLYRQRQTEKRQAADERAARKAERDALRAVQLDAGNPLVTAMQTLSDSDLDVELATLGEDPAKYTTRDAKMRGIVRAMGDYQPDLRSDAFDAAQKEAGNRALDKLGVSRRDAAKLVQLVEESIKSPSEAKAAQYLNAWETLNTLTPRELDALKQLTAPRITEQRQPGNPLTATMARLRGQQVLRNASVDALAAMGTERLQQIADAVGVQLPDVGEINTAQEQASILAGLSSLSQKLGARTIPDAVRSVNDAVENIGTRKSARTLLSLKTAEIIAARKVQIISDPRPSNTVRTVSFAETATGSPRRLAETMSRLTAPQRAADKIGQLQAENAKAQAEQEASRAAERATRSSASDVIQVQEDRLSRLRQASERANRVTERRSEAMPERYTGRQLFENARLTFRPARNRPATVVANDWGGAMLNQMLNDRFGVTSADATFTIGASDAKDLRDYLAEARNSGSYDPAQVANMDAMLKQMDAAIADAEANQQDVAFVTRRPAEPIGVTKTKIRHETAHVSQSRIAADLSALTGKNWLDSQPNAKDIHKELDRRGYAPETHDYEAAAFVASGDYGVFGMDTNQAAKFLTDYFGAVVKRHGKRALQKFGAIDPKLQPTLEAARRETETTQSTTDGRSDEAAPGMVRRIGAAGEAGRGGAGVRTERRERSERTTRGGFSFGRVPEGQGQVLASFPANIQNWLGKGKPKEADTPTKPEPVPVEWDQQKWTRKAADALVTRDMPKEDREKFFDINTKKPERLALLQKYMPSEKDIDALTAVIDRANNAIKNNDGDDLREAVWAARAITERPATNAEKASALMRAAMFSRPTGRMRDLISNFAEQKLATVARIPGSAADAAFTALRRMLTGEGERTFLGVRPGQYLKNRAADRAKQWKQTKDAWRGKHVDALEDILQHREVNFDNKFLDKGTKTVFRAMGAADQWFFVKEYQRAIREQAELAARADVRSGVIAKTDRQKQTDYYAAAPTTEMKAMAELAAKQMVFRNPNVLSDWIQKQRSEFLSPGGNFALDIVMPVDRTPTNIILTALEYSPLGAAKLAGQMATGTAKATAKTLRNRKDLPTRQAIKKALDEAFPPEKQRAMSRLFGRTVTGTSAPVALGFALASAGLATGFYDEDDPGEEAERREEGKMPNSVRIGDRWYELSGIAPLGMLIGLGATLHREMHAKTLDPEKRYARLTKGFGNMAMELPALESAKQTVKIAKATTGKPSDLGRIAGNIGARFVPGLVSDIGQATPYLRDPYEREIKAPKSGEKDAASLATKAGREFASEFGARIPGVRRLLPPKMSTLTGKPVETEWHDVIDPFRSRKAVEPGSLSGVKAAQMKFDISSDVRPKIGEPDEVFQQRKQRVEGWMQEYGDKLLSHPSYSLLTESQQQAAMESLRRRIGAQQNAAQPKLGTLAPEKVIQSVLKSEATRPKRDAGKLWVSPATRP